jgi:hypothetical protein
MKLRQKKTPGIPPRGLVSIKNPEGSMIHPGYKWSQCMKAPGRMGLKKKKKPKKKPRETDLTKSLLKMMNASDLCQPNTTKII